MDQQHIDTQRLRREVTFYVADLRKAQQQRLTRFRNDLRDAPLPSEQLNHIFSDTAHAWEGTFTHLEAQLAIRTARILASGISYATIRTELDRVSTSTLHALLDTRLTPDHLVLCSPSDRTLRVTARAWTLIMVVILIVVAVLALTSVIATAAALGIGGAAILARIALEGLCMLRVRANRDILPDLQTHMNTVSARFQTILNGVPDALSQALES